MRCYVKNCKEPVVRKLTGSKTEKARTSCEFHVHDFTGSTALLEYERRLAAGFEPLPPEKRPVARPYLGTYTKGERL